MVTLSAVVPTVIATTFFEPRVTAEIELEEIDAAEEIDAGPLHRPRVRAEGGPEMVPLAGVEPGPSGT